MTTWPRPAFTTAPSAKTDQERYEFFKKLLEFLKKMKEEGLESGPRLHYEVEKFDKNYRPAIAQTVNLVLSNFDVFAQRTNELISEILGLCLRHLTPRVQNLNGDISEPQQIIDNLISSVLLGLFSVLVKASTNPLLAEGTLGPNMEHLLRYLLAVKHKCKIPEECQCYETQQIDSAVEAAALVAAAKHIPSVQTKYLDKIIDHYKERISLKFVIALGLLYPKHNKKETEHHFCNLVKDFKKYLLSALTAEATIVISPGMMMFSQQPNDYVLVFLDFTKKISANDASVLRNPSETVEIIENFYTQKWPTASIIALEVLKNVAANEPKLLNVNNCLDYYKIGREMNFSHRENEKIYQLYANLCKYTNKESAQKLIAMMTEVVKNENSREQRAVLSTWLELSKQKPDVLKSQSELLQTLTENQEFGSIAQEILDNLERKPIFSRQKSSSTTPPPAPPSVSPNSAMAEHKESIESSKSPSPETKIIQEEENLLKSDIDKVESNFNGEASKNKNKQTNSKSCVML